MESEEMPQLRKEALAVPWLLKSKATFQAGCIKALCPAPLIFPEVQLVSTSFQQRRHVVGNHTASTLSFLTGILDNHWQVLQVL